MQDLVLFGAGGSGREIASMVKKINSINETWNLVGFIDDDDKLWGKEMNGFPILGGIDWLISYKESVVCCCTVGTMKARVAICERLKSLGIQFATLIDPSVSMGENVLIGKGCIINEHFHEISKCYWMWRDSACDRL